MTTFNILSEASYAMKLKKPIIPLLMEAGYSPDGWLGLILGTKLYFRFCSDDEMTSIDSNMQKLIKEIEKRGLHRQQDDEADAAASVEPEQAATQQTSPTQYPSKQPRPSDASKWSKEGVQSWLKENELAELCSPLSTYRGKQLRSMYDDLCASKQTFKEDLKNELGLSNITLRKFTTELEDLFE